MVSPFRPPEGCEENVIWVEEPEGTGTGCNAGHALAFSKATGEYLTPWVDDHFYLDGWDCIALPTYENRSAEFKGKPFLLGLRHIFPHHIGTQFGIYYPYFPIARKEVFEQAGWYDPKYQKGFADGDLALRVWSAGGRCEWSDRGLIQVHLEDDNRKNGVMFAQSDMDLFIERWAPKYGKGWDVSHIRGFNLDIEPYSFPELCDGNTAFLNDPIFRQRLVAGGWRVY